MGSSPARYGDSEASAPKGWASPSIARNPYRPYKRLYPRNINIVNGAGYVNGLPARPARKFSSEPERQARDGPRLALGLRRELACLRIFRRFARRTLRAS